MHIYLIPMYVCTFISLYCSLPSAPPLLALPLPPPLHPSLLLSLPSPALSFPPLLCHSYRPTAKGPPVGSPISMR